MVTVRQLFLCLLLSFPIALAAQPDVTLDNEWGARISASVEKKLMRGLHLTFEEEMRINNDFHSFSRLQSAVGLDYKLHPNIKIGVGYLLINPYDTSSSSFKHPRHRFMVDVTGIMQHGPWRFTLKERLQTTFRTGDYNSYQVSQPLVALKSRLMVKYKGWTLWEPYAAVELRTTLNAPTIDATYNGSAYVTDDGSEKGDPGWFIDGHHDCYLDRVRGTLGVTYRIDRRSTLSASLMADYRMEKVIDANKKGTKLKSYTREKGMIGWLCLSYNYSF